MIACSVASAQDVDNSSCGVIINEGTIRLRSSHAQFRNAASPQNIQNIGTIEFVGARGQFSGSVPLGSTAQRRISGMVLWSAPNARQYVQSRYYSNLGLRGGEKEINDSVFVSGEYAIDALTGIRSYLGSFHYDGQTPQYIAAERGVSAYDALELHNGDKGQPKFLVGDTAVVRQHFINHSSNHGGLTINSRGVLDIVKDATSNSELTVLGVASVLRLVNSESQLFIGNNSRVVADDGGGILIRSAVQPAAVVISTGSHLLLEARGSGGQLELGPGSTMVVYGVYSNETTALTNARFDTSSTVRYASINPNQVIQASSDQKGNRYGRLETVGGTKTTNGDVSVDRGLTINAIGSAHVVTIPDGNSIKIFNDGPNLTQVQYDAKLTDAETSSEIIGKVMQVPTAHGSQKTYVFNNRFTSLTFDDDTRRPVHVTVDCHPAGLPNNFNSTSDVQRKLNVTYKSSSSTQPWTGRFSAAFRESECQVLRRNQTLVAIRTFDSPRSVTPKRIGSRYYRMLDSTYVFHAVVVDSISNDGRHQLQNGSDFLIRAGASLITSVRDGRWSNPDTWSEHTEPFPFDTVVIRTNVWAGFMRPLDHGWDGYSVPERYPSAMASSILIHGTNAPARAALVFGIDDSAPRNNGIFRIGSSSSFTARSLGLNGTFEIRLCDASGELSDASSNSFEHFATRAKAADLGLNGLVIFHSASFPQPTLHVHSMLNSGWIQNGARLDIGDE